MKAGSIVVVGSSNTDMIIKLKRIPRPGETLLGGEFVRAAGGKGANQAVGAARAGGRVSFIARVGRDAFGDESVAGFIADQIDVQHVSRDPRTPSGVALIFLADGGQNSIAVAGGANGRLSPLHIKRAAAIVTGASILLVQLETPLNTVQTAVRLAAKAGVRVILNPAPARPLPDSLMQGISILTPNETEAELLTGIKVNGVAAAARAAARLRRRSIQTVIITMGKRGAFVSHGDMQCLVPGFKVDPVDTTGAGDIFNGALAVALAENQAMPEAVRFASAAAALSVMRLGAQPSAPRRPQIERLLKQWR